MEPSRMQAPSRVAVAALILATSALAAPAFAQAPASQPKPKTTIIFAPSAHPCDRNALACLDLALEAMGGGSRLSAVKNLSYESLSYTQLTEQSYRQAPFITSYTHTKGTIDFERQRLLLDIELTWPESDPGQFQSSATVVASPNGAVRRGKSADSPASIATVDSARYAILLGPMRLLLTASVDSGLHMGQPEILRGVLHPVIEFGYEGRIIKILINPFNHLPDAVERTATFNDFWRDWGDVTQRIYYDNWQTFHGVVYPTNIVEERNGILWQSSQIIALTFNVPTTEDMFKMDSGAVSKSVLFRIGELPFQADQKVELAPGVTLYPGPWNATIVKQDDGIVILESPLSALYTNGVIEQAKKLYPDAKVKCVLSTSDSWPHVAGVRQAVALGLPVYVLDLNQPLLDRMIAAPHTIHPDALAQSPKAPDWKIVGGKVVVGSGDNRMELYPIRGGSTERQYMVYFPAHKLLYASDTLVVNDDGSLYDPELMREVVAAVARAKLDVSTVFAMHQTPVPWSDATALVAKSQS
jgi:hypothetical protein